MLENQNTSFTSYLKCYEGCPGNDSYTREISSELKPDCTLKPKGGPEASKPTAVSSQWENINDNIQISDLRRTQSMKSVNEGDSRPKIDKKSRNFTDLSNVSPTLSKEADAVDNPSLPGINNDRAYRRVNSYLPPPAQKPISSSSPLSLRRRYSFASGSTPYLDSTKRKLTLHNLIHNSGRRILKAVEEDKVLTHSCERRLGGRSSPLTALHDLDCGVPERIVQNNADLHSELSNLRITSHDDNINSPDNMSNGTFKIVRRESLREFETPLKVYNRKKPSYVNTNTLKENPFFDMQTAAYRSDGYFKIMNAKNSVASSNNQISSCQAIRIALSTLYNLDDFHSDKIGEGFFSEVFRVRYRLNFTNI